MKYAEFEELKTTHLRLRKLHSTDVEDYYNRIGSSEDVTRYMLWQPHKSKQESCASIEKILKKYAEGNAYTWGIALAEDDTIIGRIDLLRFDEKESSCSFAYMLGSEFWGRGFGTESLKAVFGFAFEKMEMQSIVADHMSENATSGKVMQKAGMHYVTKHVSKYEKCGVFHDADEYMITIDEWKVKDEENI